MRFGKKNLGNDDSFDVSQHISIQCILSAIRISKIPNLFLSVQNFENMQHQRFCFCSALYGGGGGGGGGVGDRSVTDLNFFSAARLEPRVLDCSGNNTHRPSAGPADSERHSVWSHYNSLISLS